MPSCEKESRLLGYRMAVLGRTVMGWLDKAMEEFVEGKFGKEIHAHCV